VFPCVEHGLQGAACHWRSEHTQRHVCTPPVFGSSQHLPSWTRSAALLQLCGSLLPSALMFTHCVCSQCRQLRPPRPLHFHRPHGAVSRPRCGASAVARAPPSRCCSCRGPSMQQAGRHQDSSGPRFVHGLTGTLAGPCQPFAPCRPCRHRRRRLCHLPATLDCGTAHLPPALLPPVSRGWVRGNWGGLQSCTRAVAGPNPGSSENLGPRAAFPSWQRCQALGTSIFSSVL
jgi:hypothetical protein